MRLEARSARHSTPFKQVRPGATERVHPSRLLVPALRADASGSFDGERAAIETAVELGVGGFILFGGTVHSVEQLTSHLRARFPHPLLIGSDLERGAGQQFSGATLLPPPAALAAIDDTAVAFEAGRITAAEASSLGVNWVIAPVADLDVESRNPIVGTRSFGSDSVAVASLVAAWVEGCGSGGAIACPKHFPGHGRTTVDSHVKRPLVWWPREILLSTDIVPFRAAFGAGAASVMTAHVGYPAFDPSGEVATLSPPILQGLLRKELGFQGLVVSDALNMAGLSGAQGECEAAIRAADAGCDILLYPDDLEAVVAALEGALATGRLNPDRVTDSIEGIERILAFARMLPGGKRGITAENARWAEDTAKRSMRVLRGTPRATTGAELIELDDDLGGPFPSPSREVFARSLQANPWAEGGGQPLVAIYSDPRAWKGRAGLSEAIFARARACLGRWPDATVVLFGHPRIVDALPAARHVLCAWGGDPLMQTAAARWLLSSTNVPAPPIKGLTAAE